MEQFPQSEKTSRSRPMKVSTGELREVAKPREDVEAGFEKYAHSESREKERDNLSLFREAVDNLDLAEAYLMVRANLRFRKDVYQAVRVEFLNLIDYFLAQPDRAVSKYRSDLTVLRHIVDKDCWDDFIRENESAINEKMLEKLSAWGAARLTAAIEVKAEQAQHEIVVGRFRGLLASETPDAYEMFLQLTKARKLDLAEFPEMKQQFVAWCDAEIAKDSRDLEKATKVHLVKLRQEVGAWEDEGKR